MSSSSNNKPKRNSSRAAPSSPAASSDNGGSKRRKTGSNSFKENSFKESRKDRNIVHVIFTIDQSGSMRTDDVKKAGGKATRWKSVFDCAEEFVRVQASSGSASTLGDVVFSLILWDDDARTIFHREPLLMTGEVPGNAGTHVRSKLIEARDKNQPRGGTVFASAFREIRRLAQEDQKQSNPELIPKKYMVLFLTDGRPADLHDVKGADGKITLNETFRKNKQEFPSAAAEIRNLQSEVETAGGEADFNFIGIHPDGFKWLKRLAEMSMGMFFETSRVFEQDDDLVIVPGGPVDPNLPLPLTVSSAGGSPGPGTQMSVNSVQSQSGGGGLRQTFMQLSASLTSMRENPKKPLIERTILLESPRQGARDAKGQEEDVHMEVVKMQFVVGTKGAGAGNPKFKPVKETFERAVKLRHNPFAQGGLRNVYGMKEFIAPDRPQLMKLLRADGANKNTPVDGNGLTLMVAKESRHEVPYAERLMFHLETAACQKRAIELAGLWNTMIQAQGLDKQNLTGTQLPLVEFIKTEVYRIKDDSQPGGMRYLAVEPQLQGDYKKFNGNNGYVLHPPARSVAGSAASSGVNTPVKGGILGIFKSPRGVGAGAGSGGASGSNSNVEDPRIYDIPQCFSHWTHMKTKGQEIVVDMQGAGFRYTDPQLHSKTGKYGRADLKLKGIKDFFLTHSCGPACRALGLHRQPGPGGSYEGPA